MNIRKNKARMSFFSIISIITLMLICTAAWKMLDFSLNTYKRMAQFKYQQKTKTQISNDAIAAKTDKKLIPLSRPKVISRKSYLQIQTNPIMRKLTIGCYLLKAKIKNANRQQLIAENEKKAINILLKYNTAQDTYYKYYNRYAETPADLIIKKGNTYTIIAPDLFVLNSANSPKRAANGYYYVQTRNTKSNPSSEKQYLLNAIPADYGNSGINTFYIDQKGIVKEINNGAKPVINP